MEVDQSTFLLDLPNEILEKILDYLPFVAVRKNFRSTCKRLYNLSNAERFHRNEVIIWSKESRPHIVSILQNCFRECYNLIFSDVNLSTRNVSRFFNDHGAKVQSLSFVNCKSAAGVLESIIVQCESLCSLSIKRVNPYSFSFESTTVTRPTVTFLDLVWDSTILLQSPDIFRRIRSLFPCVKHLSVEVAEKAVNKKPVLNLEIFYFAVRFCHLESLKLNVKCHALFFNSPIFMDLLPKLDKLYLSLDSVESDIFWNHLPSRSKASSIELHESRVVYPWHIEPLLRMTSLKHLSYSGTIMKFNSNVFNALVSSQLEMISIRAIQFKWPDDATDLPSKNNETVTNLIIHRDSTHFDHSPVMSLFATHFGGLVHLEMGVMSDDILGQIFKHQKNLRSLVLQDCEDCTIKGFCGDDSKKSRSSINNLQKLEHLSIDKIGVKVFQTQIFQKAFKFPRLKYLKISLNSTDIIVYESVKVEIPVNMLKSCVSLEALHLGHFSTPSSETLSSLFEHLKHLNYLHSFISFLDRDRSTPVERFLPPRTYVNLKYFHSADLVKLLSNRNAEAHHYDEDLDRTVFTKKLGRAVSLTSPKFGLHTVDWINIT